MTEQRHAALNLHPIEALPGEPALELLKRRQIVRRTQIAAVVVLLLLALGAGRTVFSRIANAQVLQGVAKENARQYVNVARPKRNASGQTLALPGTLQGYAQSPISARASGYVKRWSKDIGSTVNKGEVLAEIDTPEIDQQLSQAVAAREQAASSLELARSTAERWEALRKKDVVSQQDLEEKRSAVAQQRANLAAADANVQRLRQFETFKQVAAPFAGVITRRNVEVGDLIDSNRVLFTLAQTDPLRVYVSVPQSYSKLIRVGQPVVVTQAELRGQRFEGKVVRTSGSIDTATRTLQVEVGLPNSDGALLPGAYVQVALTLQASQALTAPSNTLLFREAGTMVAVVDAQGRVELRRVQVGRNYGSEFEVLSGLSESDRVVLNPPDYLATGQTVVVAAPPAAPAASAASGAKGGGSKEGS